MGTTKIRFKGALPALQQRKREGRTRAFEDEHCSKVSQEGQEELLEALGAWYGLGFSGLPFVLFVLV